MITTSAIISTAPVVGTILLVEDKTWATLPLALQFVAMAATTIPASYYMRAVGRRTGFITGAFIGVIGGALGALAISIGDFTLFCITSLFTGCFNGFCQYFRFAAADASPLEFRSRAISYVLAGSVVAALFGPQLAVHSAGMLDIPYAGVYAALIGVYLLVAVVAGFVQIPKPGAAERASGGRPLAEIIRQPKFIVAVCAATFGYLVMSFVMTVTPLAMTACGFGIAQYSPVISAHVLGMYAPGFVTGTLISRYGVQRILAVGAVMLALCLLANLLGVAYQQELAALTLPWVGLDLLYLQFILALTIVGIGWNFLFTGGTALLVQCYRPEEKAKVQGINDFFIWGVIAVGAVTSGAVQNSLGWAAVNLVMAPLVVVVLGVSFWLLFKGSDRVSAA